MTAEIIAAGTQALTSRVQIRDSETGAIVFPYANMTWIAVGAQGYYRLDVPDLDPGLYFFQVEGAFPASGQLDIGPNGSEVLASTITATGPTPAQVAQLAELRDFLTRALGAVNAANSPAHYGQP